jgi:hypothetical protein
MEKLFVPYEIALKLKQLGFDENCFAKYNSKKEIDYFERPQAFYCVNSKSSWFSPIFSSKETVSKVCTAPTHQQVIDWLRDTHKIIIESRPLNTLEWWDSYVWNEKLERVWRDVAYKTYYQAINNAIEVALRLI